MLITISGPPGSGKSTVAAEVAARFGLDHVSGGDLFRSLAEERDLSLAEFNALAEEDDAIDRDLDRRLRETARSRDDVVLESRLSGWMAGEFADLKVWLDAPLAVRARRIAEREGTDPDLARAETEAREASERKRYREYYDIEFADRTIYDLAVNTARWDAGAVTALVEDAVERYDPAVDEGAEPVAANYEF